MMTTVFFTGFLLLAGCGSAVPVESRQTTEAEIFPADLQGVWQEENGKDLLRIESDRMVEFDADVDALTVRGLMRRDRNAFLLRKEGLPETWAVSLSGSKLQLERKSSEIDPAPYTATYQRLLHLPEQLELRQLPLPASRPLPEERIRNIQNEVQHRFVEEQAVLQAILKEPARKEEFQAVRQRNLVFLEATLREVGWLDAERFGSKTSLQAIFIAKHTKDLPLLLTILPYAEKEFKRAGKSQTYAILYDEVQLELGRRQRYGTQFLEDKAGDPFVLPLEDPTRVDQYLGEIGLPPLKSYLTEVSNALYEGKKTVRLDRREDG